MHRTTTQHAVLMVIWAWRPLWKRFIRIPMTGLIGNKMFCDYALLLLSLPSPTYLDLL